jgi:protein gp37
MSDGSPIEWLQRPGTKPATWNPIRALDRSTGKRGWFCVHVHEGCRFCYAERLNMKLGDTGGNGHAYAAQNRSKVDVILHEATLLQPLKWRSPRTIFPCSMTDLFGEWVSDEWLDKIFAVAGLCPQHTFIVLTKRPERMREYLKTLGRHHETDRVSLAAKRIFADTGYGGKGFSYLLKDAGWVIQNVWGLVSCSTQEDADKFIPVLRTTPLAIRGASLEPLLGPIDLRLIKVPGSDDGRSHLRGSALDGPGKLDWVVVGGESGKDARPMHPNWARSLRDQCVAAGTSFFMKQWGEHGRVGDIPHLDHLNEDADLTVRVGKHRAGRLLDGITHSEYPEARR